MTQSLDDLKIFAGNSNPPLAGEICQYLKVPLGKAIVETFSDGESKVEVKENVRGGGRLRGSIDLRPRQR